MYDTTVYTPLFIRTFSSAYVHVHTCDPVEGKMINYDKFKPTISSIMCDYIRAE